MMFEFVKQLFQPKVNNKLPVDDFSFTDDATESKRKKPVAEDYFYKAEISDPLSIQELSYEDYMQIDKLHPKN